jgi:hypothetical protein
LPIVKILRQCLPTKAFISILAFPVTERTSSPVRKESFSAITFKEGPSKNTPFKNPWYELLISCVIRKMFFVNHLLVDIYSFVTLSVIFFFQSTLFDLANNFLSSILESSRVFFRSSFKFFPARLM